MALSFGKQLRALRETRFDVAIDFQGLLKSALIGRLARVGTVFGFERRALREPASSFLLNRTVPVTDGINVIRKNLALAAGALGFDADQFPVSFPIATAPADAVEAAAIIGRTTSPFAILNPAGGWVTKLWPAEKFGLLADRLWEEFGLRSIIATAPSETELARRALEANHTATAIHATPSLKGFFELARNASVYVGGDTGPTHLAVAAGAPVVGLFGPTEWWRNGSLNPADICIERTDIGCRTDCHRRTCGNWICLDISVETVLDGVRRRLAAN
jgi:ADP-heptose:LPS heptosyltransferase